MFKVWRVKRASDAAQMVMLFQLFNIRSSIACKSEGRETDPTQGLRSLELSNWLGKTEIKGHHCITIRK